MPRGAPVRWCVFTNMLLLAVLPAQAWRLSVSAVGLNILLSSRRSHNTATYVLLAAGWAAGDPSCQAFGGMGASVGRHTGQGWPRGRQSHVYTGRLQAAIGALYSPGDSSTVV